MTPQVELVHFAGCPHADEARARLRRAMKAAGLMQSWTEWDTGEEQTPAEYRRFGSPTILVNGRDVSGTGAGNGMGCVVGGAPAVEVIVEALRRAPE